LAEQVTLNHTVSEV